jgi:hypothetical protein
MRHFMRQEMLSAFCGRRVLPLPEHHVTDTCMPLRAARARLLTVRMDRTRLKSHASRCSTMVRRLNQVAVRATEDVSDDRRSFAVRTTAVTFALPNWGDRQRVGPDRRLGHVHHLSGDALGLPLVLITWRADAQFRLNDWHEGDQRRASDTAAMQP